MTPGFIDTGGSAGGSVGKTEVLVLRELRGRGGSGGAHRAVRCLGRRRRPGRGVPGRRGPPATRGVLGRGGVSAFFGGHGFQVLLGDELKQSGSHGRADVPAGLGVRLAAVGTPERSGRRRGSGRRRRALLGHLVDRKRLPF